MFTDLNTGTNLTILGSFSVGSITFSNTAVGYIFEGGGNTMTLTNGITNLSASVQRFTNLSFSLGAAQTWNAVSGTLSFSGPITNNGNALTLAGAGTISLGGGFSGGGALIVTNAGLRRITAATTFTGNTTVSGGTLELSADAALGGTQQILIETGGTLLFSGSAALTNRINDSVAFRLGGGTLNTGGLSERLGTLTLSANSTLNFGSGSSVIRFAASSGQTWTSGRTLTLANWTSGSDRLFFGSSASGLTAGQLAQISFLNPSGFATGTYPAMMLGTGEVVPVPEPITLIAPLSLLGWLGWRRVRHQNRSPRQ
jgi:autotransporter-associated beta strand protein